MSILQVSVSDSLSQEDILTGFVDYSIMNVEVLDSVFLPIIILIICSLVKYVVAIELRSIDWFGFISEMAIDLLTIFGSFLIGQYSLVSSRPGAFQFVMAKVGIIAIALIIVSILRRAAFYFKQKSTPSYFEAGSMIFMEYLSVCVCFVIVNIIK